MQKQASTSERKKKEMVKSHAVSREAYKTYHRGKCTEERKTK